MNLNLHNYVAKFQKLPPKDEKKNNHEIETQNNCKKRFLLENFDDGGADDYYTTLDSKIHVEPTIFGYGELMRYFKVFGGP